MKSFVMSLIVLGLTSALCACSNDGSSAAKPLSTDQGTPTASTSTTPIATSTSTLPTAVHVACSADGIHVDEKKIQTQPAGVSLVISSTLPKGSYLSYGSTGHGGVSGGDPLPAKTAQRFLSLAPGMVTLGCDAVDARTGVAARGTQATFEVTDPTDYWRTDPDLVRAGCDYGNGILDWKSNYFQTSSTAAKAAEAVALEFASSSQGHGGSFAAQPATVGYVGAATQVWLIRKDGSPYVSVLVHRTSKGFTASPDARCDQ